MDVASMMEYEQNTYAINLRTNKSNILGVIVPFISNYFYHSFIAAVEEETRKTGHSLLILQSGDDPVAELENLKICRSNRVGGIFISVTPNSKDITPFLRYAENETPVIFFDKVPVHEACNKVCVADAEAASMAAEEIIKHKKKRVLAIFGNPELSITKKRLTAFKKTFEKNNLLKTLSTVHASSPEEAMRQTISFLARKSQPDVIFSMSDEILTGVMKALQVKKIKIPAEVGVIAISNDGFIPKLYEPEITYVETSGHELGKLAFKRMTDHLNGKTFIQELLLPSRLVLGRSL